MSNVNPEAWSWPGSRWWRCDLHIHTPASHDFTGAGDAAELVEAAIDAGLDAVGITDHNTAALVEAVAAAAGQGPLIVFPGVEITSNEGAHLIALFAPGTGADVVKGFLGACGIPGEKWGKDDAHAKETYERCVVLADEHGAVSIAAHADRPAAGAKKETSLIHVLAGQGLRDVLNLPQMHSVEVCTEDATLHRQLQGFDSKTKLPMRPRIAGSDAHAVSQVGRRSAWIKMSRPDQEGLRLAFADGEMSATVALPGPDPNEHAALVIESIEISEGKLIGRGKPFSLTLNPWLNTVIGGRGTGKSSVVEFLRLGLGREDELPESLRSTFADFAKVGSRTDRGLLTADTHVSVVYRKDGSRFRVQWSKDGKAPPIEENTDEGWTAVEGSVQERFPVRIYSQKQIFEIAIGPQSLLRVIDESAQVNRIEWNDRWRTSEAEFLALRARARQLETQLADEGRLRGHLDDVNKKLAVFESSNHSDVLRAYRTRQDQLRAVEDWQTQLADVSAGLLAAAEAVSAAFNDEAFDSGESTDAAVLEAVAETQGALDEIRKGIAESASGADALLQAWLKKKDSLAWAREIERTSDSYATLVERLKAEGIGRPEEYAELVRERESVTGRLRELDRVRTQLDEANKEADQSLSALLDLRRELTKRRGDFLNSVLATNKHVRISVTPYGDRESAEPSFRSLISRDAPLFQNDISSPEGTGLIPGLYADFEAGNGSKFEGKLDKMRNDVVSCARGQQAAWNLRDRRFAEYLHGLAPETLDRLSYWSPDDTVEVFYSRAVDGSDFQPIQQGSPGQKTAAILAFLLAYGDEPIVLDQPEDDLDNTLIYDLIVNQLRENKRRRQIIVVTHNANIVVNGDAELVVALGFANGQTRIESFGGLQERDVREAVCRIMEGGRPAFEQRYQRIGRAI